MLKSLWRRTHWTELKSSRLGRAKLEATMSKLEPVVNKLRPKSTVDFCGTASTEKERVPGNIGPALISPLILCLQELSMSIKSNFFSETRNVVRGNNLTAKRDFNWKMSSRQWVGKCTLIRMRVLSFKLVGRHCIAENI